MRGWSLEGGGRKPSFYLESVRNSVNLIRTITIKPGQEIQVKARLKGKGNPDKMNCMLTPARTLFMRTGALVANTCVKPRKGTCAVRVLNASEQHVTLYKRQTMGVLEPVNQVKRYAEERGTDVTVNNIEDSDDDIPLPPPRKRDEEKFEIPSHILQDKEATKRYLKSIRREVRDRKLKEDKLMPEQGLPPHMQDLFERTKEEVAEEHHEQVRKLLTRHAGVFAKDASDMGKTSWVKHDIDTGNHSPVRQRPRRLRLEQKEEVQKQIKNLQESGLIRPSTSEWASNVVLVKKKDGSWRMCIDYRDLNLKTLNPDSYMLPRIDDTLDALNRAKYFCTLDILQGYHNVELTDQAKQKTAFHAPFCNPSHWEYVFMPFGLVRAPRTFQRLMDRVLQGLDHKIALAYIDDIIVYRATVP